MRSAWTHIELEAIVADYFQMLEAELKGQAYNKAAHRRALKGVLINRSEGSIERKHMNISAVLRDIGHPWIDGYKPYSNYQKALAETVAGHIARNTQIASTVEEIVVAPQPELQEFNFALVWEEPPEFKADYYTSKISDKGSKEFVGRKRNYLREDASNKKLGNAGELFVLEYEEQRLRQAGQKKLANKIEHVAQTQGDGLGYDVLSFDVSGKERLIEVKTTSFGKRTPFYVSKNEVSRSVVDTEIYHLYRVFDFRKSPRVFGLKGRLDRAVKLEPTQYRAHF